jgi:hypothetical protein
MNPAWFCRPCALHNRRTIVHADERPETPCGHGCARVEWVCREWFCVTCWRHGHTIMLHSHERPDCGCERCHHTAWVETDLSQWVLGEAA